MQLLFVWVGKTKNKHWAALEEDYLGRINHFVPGRIAIIRETKSGSPTHLSRGLKREGEKILSSLGSNTYAILLDECGEMLSSAEFAQLIARRQMAGVQQMAFIVGGPEGVDSAVRQRVQFLLSLSRMTFPHEMARVILLEQVYRAFAIIHKFPYPR
ncbi:MAG: 23S rRNA (pseudouridine(1915)-N(3))-methyltransferase RlmH [Acidobacteria bacterium]|nr:MAG: 23S rRNA (pseudouridine(1915)-N(3))-methyltransferase RlmH [Acidobacteriota bacterium]